MKKVLALALSLALIATLAISGTVAYLTDTATVTNTIEVGNVNIDLTEPSWKPDKLPTLLPGVEIPKDPRITNTGKTDAWVWMEVSIPTSVYNVLNIAWDKTGSWEQAGEPKVVGTNTVVTMKHNALLGAKEITVPAFETVTVDPAVKELPVVETLDIVVTAYAIQDQPFEDINAAMKAYDGDKAVAPYQVGTAAELVSALSNKTITEDMTIALTSDIDMSGVQLAPASVGTKTAKATVTVLGNGHTISNMSLVAPDPQQNGMNNVGMFYMSDGSTLNISNLTIKNAKTQQTNEDAAIVVGYAEADSTINLTNVDIVNGTVNNSDNAALYVGYTVGKVNLTNCEATGTVNGTVGKTGAFIGTANTVDCVVTFNNCWNGTAMNDIGRVVNDATVTGESGKITNVSTAADLAALSAKALTEYGKDETAIINITADIDMNGMGDFNAIVAQRSGTLIVNGNGHTISNVSIVSGADSSDNTTGQASMFYCATNSTLEVSNLTLKNLTVKADENASGYAAAVIGYCEGTAKLTNVDVVNANVTGAKSSGMLVGHLSGTLTAADCDVSGTVELTEYEDGGHYAGKYIGTVAGPATLTSCTENVTVDTTNLKDVAGNGSNCGRTANGYNLTIN